MAVDSGPLLRKLALVGGNAIACSPVRPSAKDGLLHQCKLSSMVIGQRIRELRQANNLSQGDLEQRTGLLRCYTSRVENGHTVPTIETLEKYARALEVPLYRLFYEGEELPKNLELPSDEGAKPMWGAKGHERDELRKFAKALSRMDDHQRSLLLGMAQRMAGRKRRK